MITASARARAAAARILSGVARGRSLDTELGRHFCPENEKAFLQALVYGALRERGTLHTLIQQMIPRPPELSDFTLTLMMVGLHQLRGMNVPEHAAVQETVAACEVLKIDDKRPLVNAILRRYQREAEELISRVQSFPLASTNHPDWMREKLEQDWGDKAASIIEQNNIQAPMVLRVNAKKISTRDYLARCAKADIAAHAHPFVDSAAILESALPVERVPGFSSGMVSVQDAAAQLATSLLDVKDGQRILDACAAPGGKTGHILERCKPEKLVALDIDNERLTRVHENLLRLRGRAELVAGDAATKTKWWDGQLFDRILIDAPCSGTGVIRRHPDIKWLRRLSDIDSLAIRQQQILENCWGLLKPGGRIVFATCSLFRQEGVDVARQFLQETPDAKEVVIDAEWGEAEEVGRRIAPSDLFDGFYYAVFTKPDGA